MSHYPHADLSRWQASKAAQSLVDVKVPDPASLADLAVEIVEFIGAEFRREQRELATAGNSNRGRSENLDVGTKSTQTDPVTRLDTQFEAAIRGILAQLRPHDTLLGEEGGGELQASGITWIADPVDGTVNLVYGLPLSAVSLGVVVDGEFVAGAVHALGLGETYCAAVGTGARMRSNAGHTPQSGPWRTLSVNSATELGMSLIATGFSYSAEVRREQGAVVARLLPQVRDIRRLGAAALDLCHVAAGRVDAFYERDLKIWDYAAGIVIVREAGGKVFLPQRDEPMVAAAPGIVDALADIVRE